VKRVFLSALVILLSVCSVSAANHYVRAGAGGIGADWSDALSDLPASLTRGDTYCLAGGAYAHHDFNDALSGESVITIKFATVADHCGQNTGWLDSYAVTASNQAVFGTVSKNTWVFHAGYYTFTGGTRSTMTTGYSVKLDNVVQNATGCCGYGILFGAGATTDHISIDYVDIPGWGVSDTTHYYTPIYGATALSVAYLYLGHLYVHDISLLSDGLMSGGWDHPTLEYSYFARIVGDATHHKEFISDSGSNYFTIRYNVFMDCCIAGGTGFIVSLNSGPISTSTGWAIYGNVFGESSGNSEYSVGHGVVVCSNNNVCINWVMYNNVIVNNNLQPGGQTSSSQFAFDQAGVGSSGNVAINNLWYLDRKVGCVGPSLTCSYNYYAATQDTSNPVAETGAQIDSQNPFVDWVNGDFHLARATNNGSSLSSPYNIDPTGATRGADGVWDRGAYEFTGFVARPNPPQNVRVTSVK